MIGVLGPALLDQTIDSAALVGYPVARSLLGFDGAPTTIYERSTSETVAGLVPLPATVANPADPGSVKVSRPSDVLVARSAIESAYNGLFLGLGGIAGLAIGSAVAGGYAISRDWAAVTAASALVGGLAASVFAGTLAGIYPAARAARLSPTEALRAAG